MNEWLLTPPAVFLMILAVIGVLSMLVKSLSPQGSPSAGKEEPYACGQDVPTGRFQPGYDDFFHFAFMFTILDVVTLMVGTVSEGAVWLTVAVLAVIGLAVIILFRRD